MMCDARLFGPQIAELSAEFAVTVAPLSQGERVEEMASSLLDLLPGRFALAGQGLGGVVAMELLRRAPDRLSRIALMGTGPLAETPVAAAAREQLIVKARAGRLDEVMQSELRAEALAAGPDQAEVLALVMDMAEVLGPQVYVRQARALQRRRDQQAVLRKSRLPTMVLCGAEDGLVPVKRHSFMAELIPHARLEVIEGAGHFPSLEQPAATTAALRAWMAQPLVLH
jgi:pimeloyl-ACP methyl ester carboxylesterase